MNDPRPGRSRPAGARTGWVEWLEDRINLTEIFSFLTHFGFVHTPVDTSRPVRDVVRELATEPVPSYTRGPRVLGLLATILFGLVAVTGVLLAYYYRPTPEAAFESTRTIVRDLPAGWFVHQVHAWGTYLLVAVVLLRLFRFFWDGLYRAPREVLWMSAVALVVVVMQLDLTGHLLTWDTQSYWSTVRGLEVIWALPVIGPVLAFLLGGRVVNQDVLIRFYVLHLLVLPMAFVAILYVTFGTLRRVGLSPAPAGRHFSSTTLRDHLYSLAILGFLLFGVLVTLATLLPFRFEEQADPYSTPGGVRPPWYLLAPYVIVQGLRWPTWIGGTLLVAVGLAVFLLPFWAARRGEPDARRFRIGGIAVLALWAVLTAIGAWMDR